MINFYWANIEKQNKNYKYRLIKKPKLIVYFEQQNEENMYKKC